MLEESKNKEVVDDEKDGLRFQWLFRREENLWEDKGVRDYGRSQEAWTSIWAEVIREYGAEKSAFWVVCIDGTMAIQNFSVRCGVENGIYDYIKKHEIAGYMKQIITKEPPRNSIEGKLVDKGYYLIVYLPSVPSEEIYQQLLDMLNSAVGEKGNNILNVDRTVETIKVYGANPFMQMVKDNVESAADQLIDILRMGDKGKIEDSEVKLRGVYIIADIFDLIRENEILLPKQIKAVGKIIGMPKYKSAEQGKVVHNVANKENANISKEYTHEIEQKTRKDISDDLDKYNDNVTQMRGE